MVEFDGGFQPFGDYPGYSLMAPCMRSCDRYLEFNGCDNSNCWCKKSNLDRRVSSLERCASTSCTFADMNTATDVSILSSIQLQYCVDRDLSPAGMTLPSTALAQPTESSSNESPLETSGSPTGGLGLGVTSGTGSATGSRPSGGPKETGASITPPPSTSSHTGLSTGAKAGIAIGGGCLILLALLITLLLRRRKRTSHPPPFPTPAYPPEYTSAPPPHMAQAPPQRQNTNYGEGAGLFAPPAARGDVSPIEEKSPALVHTVSRKEVGSPPVVPASPPVQSASPAPTEVAGSAPPRRHEVHGEDAAGGYATAQGGRWVYEMQGGGVGREGAVELGGGR